MKKLIWATTCVGILAILGGCAGSGGAVIGNTNPRVRVVNAVTGTNVSATITDNNGSQTLLNNQPFASASTQAIVTNGNRTVTVTNPGGQIVCTQTPLFELSHDYTCIALGPVGANNMIVLSDTSQPAVGNALIRFADGLGAPDPVDIYMGPSGSSIAQANLLVNNISTNTGTAYMNVAAGQTKFFVTGSSDQIPISTQEFPLLADTKYTIVVGRNPNPVMFIVQEP